MKIIMRLIQQSRYFSYCFSDFLMEMMLYAFIYRLNTMNVLSVHLKQNSKYFDRVFSKFQFSMGIVNFVPQSNRGPGVQVIYNGFYWNC